MNNVGLILWDGEKSIDDAITHQNIMRGCGINRICVAATGQFSTKIPSPIITLFEKEPVGSYIALLRGLKYCEMSFMHDKQMSKGVFVHYLDKPISPYMISKVMQLSTICEQRDVDIIMALQLVERDGTPKYSVGRTGLVEASVNRKRGLENMGLLYFSNKFMAKAPKKIKKINDFLEWVMTSNQIKIHGLIQSCAKYV